jgi:protein N-terminal amidase
MDLIPQSPSWTFDGGPFEVADHCLKTGSGLLILLNAWLDSEEEKDTEEDISTMNYWATLLKPLWYNRMGNDGEESDAEPRIISEDSETIVVICNRSGTENGEHFRDISLLPNVSRVNVLSENVVGWLRLGATFAGSSSLFHLRQNAGHPFLLENMSRRQEGVCVWTT